MKNNLSLVMIAYNAEGTIEQSLISVQGLVDDIIIVDNYSTDKTVDIAKKYGVTIIFYQGKNRGIQCQLGINQTTNNWVLILDSDETVSKELKQEIVTLLNCYIVKEDGFFVPFQSYYLGRKLYRGGENYKKLILFRRDKAKIEPLAVHYVCQISSGKIGTLKNKVNHYSYRNLLDIYKKFFHYGLEEAKLKIKAGEKTSFKKIFFYPAHMFWSRFIKDKGYKDGLFRIPLDLGFAYMEFVTYASMLFIRSNIKYQRSKLQIKIQK